MDDPLLATSELRPSWVATYNTFSSMSSRSNPTLAFKTIHPNQLATSCRECVHLHTDPATNLQLCLNNT